MLETSSSKRRERLLAGDAEKMLRRCSDMTHMSYGNYGGRGIKVCGRWLNSFENFYEDMGTRPSPKHSLDRINFNGNYEPSNCRWSTTKEQRWNQRRMHCETCTCLKNGQLAKWKKEAEQKAQLSLV